MITITSDFECGNARNVERLGEGRYRLEVVGDKPTYCYYFCFDVTNAGDAGEVAIEVWHDPAINDVPGFISHFPCTVWIRDEGLQRYRALDQRRVETGPDHLVIHLPIGAGQTIRVTNNWPAPYSETCDFLRRLADDRDDRCALINIGKSAQGRDLLGLRVGPSDAPRVLCIAGQHPIEFPGTWGMRAIADYASSLIPSAVTLRETLRVEIIPVVNPDGNVAGRNGYSAEDLDMYAAFPGDPDAAEPVGTESKLLWAWANQKAPALWMNTHCYLGWRLNSECPYDGWYELIDSPFPDERQALLYEALCHTMRLLTDGPSTSDTPGALGPVSMCYQLAKRMGTAPVFYEINGSTAGAFGSGKRALNVFKQVVETLRGAQE